MMATPRYYKQVLKLISDYDAPSPVNLGAAAQRQIMALRRIVADPDLVGLGIAEKEAGGERIGALALIFYVRRKRARSGLAPALVVPPVIAAPNGKAIYTDVVEIGDVVPQATRNPIASGHSVAHVTSDSGTLGAIVTKNGKPMLLSNAHVLAAAGTAGFDEPILYPAPGDGGVDPADRIGTLAAFRPFKLGGAYVNRVDAALGLLLDGVLGRVDAAIAGARLPLTIGDPVCGTNVTLTGRSSGSVRSQVSDADATVQVYYPAVGVVGFASQMLCRPAYTLPGDSGALVLDSDSGHIVGLHFAASTLGSYFTPIRTVMSSLGFSF